MIDRAWEGGPLREWDFKNPGSWIRSTGGKYLGSYICDCCNKPVGGLYYKESKWLCGACILVPVKPDSRAICAIDSKVPIPGYHLIRLRLITK